MISLITVLTYALLHLAFSNVVGIHTTILASLIGSAIVFDYLQNLKENFK